MGPGFLAEIGTAQSPLAEFERIATAAGHDMSELEAGHLATAYLRVGDIHSLRWWMSHAAETARAKRLQSFDHFGGRARLWQGVHDRGEAYIFAGEPLEERDVERMGEHFPARLKVVSARNIELAAAAVLDVSATAEDWEVGTREELYTLFNVGTLTIGPGARVIVRGNVFSMVVQHLDVRESGAREIGQDNHHIGILPTPHPVDSRLSGPLDGPSGSAGSDGQPGRDGKSLQFRASVFGPAAANTVAIIDRDGNGGANGLDGQTGRRGRTGGMCKTAEISIRSFAASSRPLTIFCQAGQGGRGGAGGKGGDGGQGGNAGRGGASFHDSQFGNAGAGGNGGNGGRGGNGGNGGISSNVFISCPPNRAHLIAIKAVDSQGGFPGQGGAGGRGGMPGNGMTATATAAPGTPGRPGASGLAGRSRPKARIHINEILQPNTRSFHRGKS
ncbi:hypothetical protein [Ensifer sp. SSB1]|jgi:hypothetical protein|uniref:hypothetical protein n=1 Tax=Ensifer sp. SSB1 TaxID=2795385 RepID=UPI001A4EFEBD|nr:hypothetical protein [Ensifer sp. SSB1]MBK5571829.1 hypothetical protein [Ensifer sp. SSB1]